MQEQWNRLVGGVLLFGSEGVRDQLWPLIVTIIERPDDDSPDEAWSSWRQRVGKDLGNVIEAMREDVHHGGPAVSASIPKP